MTGVREDKAGNWTCVEGYEIALKSFLEFTQANLAPTGRRWDVYRGFLQGKITKLKEIKLQADGSIRDCDLKSQTQAVQRRLICADKLGRELVDLDDLKANTAEVRAIQDASDAALYSQFRDAIGQDEDDQKILLSKFMGTFYYFRYFQKEFGELPHIVEGEIVVSESDGIVRFAHRSEDWIESGNEIAEHAGWVFRQDDKLFLLGTKEGVIRLAIVGAPKNTNLTKDGMDGFVLSVRSGDSTHHHNPFAAAAVLFRNDCADLANFRSQKKDGKTNLFDSRFKKAVTTVKRGDADEWLPFLSL